MLMSHNVRRTSQLTAKAYMSLRKPHTSMLEFFIVSYVFLCIEKSNDWTVQSPVNVFMLVVNMIAATEIWEIYKSECIRLEWFNV